MTHMLQLQNHRRKRYIAANFLRTLSEEHHGEPMYECIVNARGKCERIPCSRTDAEYGFSYTNQESPKDDMLRCVWNPMGTLDVRGTHLMMHFPKSKGFLGKRCLVQRTDMDFPSCFQYVWEHQAYLEAGETELKDFLPMASDFEAKKHGIIFIIHKRRSSCNLEKQNFAFPLSFAEENLKLISESLMTLIRTFPAEDFRMGVLFPEYNATQVWAEFSSNAIVISDMPKILHSYFPEELLDTQKAFKGNREGKTATAIMQDFLNRNEKDIYAAAVSREYDGNARFRIFCIGEFGKRQWTFDFGTPTGEMPLDWGRIPPGAVENAFKELFRRQLCGLYFPYRLICCRDGGNL